MNAEQEHQICFLILIGLPGSGKTTFSSYLAHCLENPKCVDLPFYCVIQVCYDKIINPLNNPQWNESRRKIVNTVDEVIGKLKKCVDPASLANEYNLNIVLNKVAFSKNPRILVVVDDNMYYRSMRYQYYQIARTHQASYCQLHIKCDTNKCLARNFQRHPDEQIPESIILKMAANLEEPDACNYSWEIYSISIISNEPFTLLSLKSLNTILNDAFSHPVQPIHLNLDKEQSQIVCSVNIIHQADLILRRIIGNIIKERKDGMNHKQIKELSAHLYVKKQELLQNLKSGQLKLPEEIIEGVQINSVSIHSFFSKEIMREIPHQ